MINYYLMNKDKAIAKLEVTDSFIGISDILDIVPPYIGNIQSWVQSRLTPVGRPNIQKLLKMAQIHDEDEFLFITKAISLTDTFWVNNSYKPMKWEQVNPFKRRFSRIISEIALNCECNKNTELKSPSPEYTVDGSVHKCWKRINGQIYLFKTDGVKWSDVTGNRPYCEYYASQVAQALNLRYFVSYGLKVNKIQNREIKPYVYSRIFTSEKYGYAPLESTVYKNMDIEELIQAIKKNNSKQSLVLMEMLLLDAITMNIDRHMGNYGFMFDTDTYKIVGVAPIFDNDCALGYNKSLQTNTFEEVWNMLGNMFPKTCAMEYTEQGKYALKLMHQIKDDITGKTYEQIMVQKLKSIYPFKFKRLQDSSTDLSDNRIQFMEFIVNNQIKEILS